MPCSDAVAISSTPVRVGTSLTVGGVPVSVSGSTDVTSPSSTVTIGLSMDGAGFVDIHVWSVAHSIGIAALDRLIGEARTRFDPAAAEALRVAAGERRCFDVHAHQVSYDGTIDVTGTLDLADAPGKARQLVPHVVLADAAITRLEETSSTGGTLSVAPVQAWCTNPDTQVMIVSPAGDAARRHLRVPLAHPQRPALRPRPPHPLRPGRPNNPSEPGAVVPASSPDLTAQPHTPPPPQVAGRTHARAADIGRRGEPGGLEGGTGLLRPTSTRMLAT